METQFDRFERRPDFVKWMTRGPNKRWALLNDGCYRWACVVAGHYVIDVRLSQGGFYDDMGPKVPGPGTWHRDARVAAAQSAREYAAKIRAWCRPAHEVSKLSGFGWPMVPSPTFPKEMTNACPKCGSTNVTITGAYAPCGTGPGGRGRLGDPGATSWLRCEACGHKSTPRKD